MSKPILYGGMVKDAGNFSTDLHAGINGIGTATQGINPFLHPFQYAGQAYEGLTHGFAGSVGSRMAEPLRQQGVQFQTDQYGQPTGVDIGQSIKNYGGKLLNQATGGAGFNGQGLHNFIGQAGNFASQHKGLLLGGLGGLAGGYVLSNWLGGNHSKPQPRYSPPQPYAPMQQPMEAAPQAFQKMGSESHKKGLLGSYLPEPMGIPQAMANVATGGAQLPFIAPPQQEELGQPSLLPYAPHIGSSDPKLHKMLRDPRMRDYLTNLVREVNTQE